MSGVKPGPGRGYAFAQSDSDRSRRITQYMYLVRRVARRIIRRLPSVVELDDLEQVGVIGLIDAIDRYNATRSQRFDAYAEYRIKGAIYDHLRHVDHLSRRHRGRVNGLRNAVDRLGKKLDRVPTSKEIAVELEISEADVETLRSESTSSWLTYDEAGSADDTSRSTGGAVLASLSQKSDILDEVARSEESGILAGAVGKLPERLQLLLALYYQEDLTYREIAEVLGVTVGRVSQLHSEATKRLKGLLGTQLD